MGRMQKRSRVPLLLVFREAATASGEAGEAVDGGERDLKGLMRRTAGEGAMREDIVRNLDRILNTTNLASSCDLSSFPAVERSILNFGLPDIVHRTLDERQAGELIGDIGEAIRRFEPRIARDSLSVSRLPGGEAQLRVRYLIKADMLFGEVAIPLDLLADIELESGRVRVGAP